jgi:hypothetical protein
LVLPAFAKHNGIARKCRPTTVSSSLKEFVAAQVPVVHATPQLLEPIEHERAEMRQLEQY